MEFNHIGKFSLLIFLLAVPAHAQELGQRDLETTFSLPGLKKNFELPKNLQLPQPHPSKGGLLVEPEALIPKLESETLLDALKRKQIEVQIPSDPEAIATALTIRAKTYGLDCPKRAYACAQQDQLTKVAEGLRLGSSMAMGCAAAALEFQKSYTDGDPPPAVARNYDMACLRSIERRSVNGVPEELVAPPALFGPEVHGALSAIGILEEKGSRPFCGGLIRNDRTVVTAHHCYEGKRQAFLQGAITVRPADGRHGPWRLAAEPVAEPASQGDAVKDDWVVLRIDTLDSIDAHEASLQPLSALGEVTVLGHYAYFPEVDYVPGTPAENWRRGLRYPKPGLCQAVKVVGYCLQIACQTVRGFSGTPVFSASASKPDSPLRVVGFVSQPDQDAGQCNGFVLNGSTYAVSADAVK